jgi:hypothetical protein
MLCVVTNAPSDTVCVSVGKKVASVEYSTLDVAGSSVVHVTRAVDPSMVAALTSPIAGPVLSGVLSKTASTQ